MLHQLNGKPVEITNAGQMVIYNIRKAFSEGELSVTDNVDEETQAFLNKPQKIDRSKMKINDLDREYLKMIIDKVEKGDIKLFTPSSLLNEELYNQLDSAHKAKADYYILIFLQKIREIKKLWDAGDHDSYQIYNLIHSLRLIKENQEASDGDIFII